MKRCEEKISIKKSLLQIAENSKIAEDKILLH